MALANRILSDEADHQTLHASPQRVSVERTVLWVFGSILARSGCQNAVATELSFMGSFNSIRQYLREWLYDGQDRSNPCRVQLDVRLSFVPLLKWLLELWESDRLVLAIDPTMKGDRINAIVISVVYRSCAIPVAWRILPANTPGRWMESIVDMLGMLSEAMPKHMTVLVMCDRGLRSPRLWDRIRCAGWHPYVRQSINTVFCPDGGTRLPARYLVAGPRTRICWVRDGFQQTEHTPTRNDDRGMGQRSGRAMGGDDRSCAHRSGSVLVHASFLDRIGLQDAQELWVAVAKHSQGRSRTSVETLVGDVGGNAVDAGVWHQSGRRQRPGYSPRSSEIASETACADSSQRTQTNRKRASTWCELSETAAAQGQTLAQSLVASRTVAQTTARHEAHLPCRYLKQSMPTPVSSLRERVGVRVKSTNTYPCKPAPYSDTGVRVRPLSLLLVQFSTAWVIPAKERHPVLRYGAGIHRLAPSERRPY